MTTTKVAYCDNLMSVSFSGVTAWCTRAEKERRCSIGSSPCQVETLIQKEEPLDAGAPLIGSCCQAHAAPSHLAHLLPDVLALQ